MSLGHLLWAFLISASPIVELRLALPLAILEYHIPWYLAFLVCFLGNLLPVPFLLLFLDPITRLVSKIEPLERIINWVFKRTRRRGEIVERYERIGLVLLVAIPLPGTGAWTGSIVAFLLGLGIKSAFLSIVLGVFIAGVIVTALSLLGWVGGVIAGIGIATLFAFRLWRI
jgi:uncharacterized membrane protein